MPLSPEHQAARRYKQRVSRKGQFNPEPAYTVEAGDHEGIKFRWVIQYGYDFHDSCNVKAAARMLDDAILACPFPLWKGTVKHGRFSERTKFLATWLEISRDGIVERRWGDRP